MACLDFKKNRVTISYPEKGIHRQKPFHYVSKSEPTIIPPDMVAQSLKGMILDPTCFRHTVPTFVFVQLEINQL